MKKLVIFSLLLLTLGVAGCGQKLIDDGNGHKQFKDSNGNFVKNDWAEISGKYYYFDMNGYLVTSQWVQDEYYVDDKGVMQTNYWYKDNNGEYYYLGNDGKYLKNCIRDVDGHKYAFDENGKWIRNRIFINPEDLVHFMYANEDGEIVKSKNFFLINGLECNIDEKGFFICDEWKNKDGKWYYFGDNGFKCVNSLINDEFAVDEEGVMIINQKRVADNMMIYTFGSDGKVIKKEDGKFYTIISKLKLKENSTRSKIDDYCKIGANNAYLEYSSATTGRYYESFVYGAAPEGTYALDKNGEKHIQLINEYFGLSPDLAYKISHTYPSNEIHTAENEIVFVSYSFLKSLNSEYYLTSIRYTYKNILNTK